ncbi:reverse transcriptase [Gossypium australe]|uniref:Reverse transcriptase n=1 Tax=Gossypium australe TaxID=47621 RepID=A0A5B6WIL7_9ROSI|nr:reverse transcriptase [Gossypium australe]
MDRLTEHNPIIDFKLKRVTLRRSEGVEVVIVGDRVRFLSNVVSSIKAGKIIGNGCEAYLAYVMGSYEKEIRVYDIRIVKDFPNVFPDKLPGLPPDHEVEFSIALYLGSSLVAVTPCRMAPKELKELMIQLEELHERVVVVFIDGILKYSQTKEEHDAYLRTMLLVLQEKQLFVKLSKCEFWLREGDFALKEQGILCFHGRLYVPCDEKLRHAILTEAHNSLYAMHLGSNKMKYRADPSHVVIEGEIEVRIDLTYDDEPVVIIAHKEKVLRNKKIPLVKVL